MEILQDMGFIVGMTGDGVNDGLGCVFRIAMWGSNKISYASTVPSNIQDDNPSG